MHTHTNACTKMCTNNSHMHSSEGNAHHVMIESSIFYLIIKSPIDGFLSPL